MAQIAIRASGCLLWGEAGDERVTMPKSTVRKTWSVPRARQPATSARRRFSAGRRKRSFSGGTAPGRHEAEVTHLPFSGPAGGRLFAGWDRPLR
jgi:hypothetical protein